jgi:wobble nucleotide-excising tRNase
MDRPQSCLGFNGRPPLLPRREGDGAPDGAYDQLDHKNRGPSPNGSEQGSCMIETIHLSSVATYAGAPQTLQGLKHFNFFYGSNGSGKTTISRVIADPGHPDHAQCRLVWKNGQPIEALVYNRDFVDSNFSGDDIKGVFTVGKRSVEALKEIAKLKAVAAEQLSKVTGLQGTLRGPDAEVDGGKLKEAADLTKGLQAKCWLQKVKHEIHLAGALEGYRADKSRFLRKVLDTLAAKPAEGFVAATVEDMRDRAKTVYGPSRASESFVPVPSSAKLIELEASPILAKVVVGKKDVDVAALIERLGNSDWVKQGQPYLAASEGTCPFCQQPEPPKLAESLARYFDEAFLADTAAIASLESAYSRAAQDWLASLDATLESKHPRVEIESLRTRRDAVAARIDANLLLIAAKRREPSRPIELRGISEAAAAAVEPITAANAAIKTHNATVANLSNEKAKLTAQVWRHIVDVDLKTTLEEHGKKAGGLDRAIASLREQIAKAESERAATDAQIKALERDATSVQPTIDSINRLLVSYGFRSFSIERDGNRDRYRLRRPDGASAHKTLSEGERTFITFLYFYFLAQGSASETGTQTARVAVLDDPVSSLDSDVLFIVSSLIHRLMESVRAGDGPVRQVLLLTHNVHFHKEVSFNPNRRGGALNEETFWVVRKVEDRSLVESHADNPVSSSYEMLWADVRRPGPHAPGIQNTLRRILETYFKILGNLDFNRIADKFEPEDQPTCKSLFSWVNAGSHGALDDLHFALDASSIDRHLRVFEEVFKVSDHLPHYKMMMRQEPI